MRIYNKIFCLSCFLIFHVWNVSAQAVVNTTGSTITSPSLVIDYSVGEIAVATLTNEDHSVTQGVLQPNLKFRGLPCELYNTKLLNFENPVKDKLRLVGEYNWITEFQIYAADGKLIYQSKFYNNYVDVKALSAGVYFIRLFPGCNGNNRVIKFVKQ